VKYRPITRQRLRKDIATEAYASNNRTSIARGRISKHASLTIEAVLSACSVPRDYKRQRKPFESAEMPVCRNMSLGAEELN
jgi:hypothetical protein